jgi:hypothetical protein
MAPEPPRPRRSRTPLVAAAALLLLFGTISWFAVATKSPTMDEPLHITGAYLHVFARDDRINPEDPPLWKYWMMLPQRAGSMRIDRDDDIFRTALTNIRYESLYSVHALFLTPGVEFDRIVRQSRFMMLLAGMALGGMIAWWGWQLRGGVGALVATALYALDPNFIAHAPLVKNDVAISLLFLVIAMLAWHVGCRARGWNVAVLALACGAAVATKFSGVLVGPMILLILTVRVALPEPWLAFGRSLNGRGSRALLAAAVLALCAIASVGVIWATYGFRFGPTPNVSDRLDMQLQIDATKRYLLFLSHDQRYPSPGELASMPDPLVVRAVTFAERHRMLPQPYLYGFLFTYQSSLVRDAYLLGRQSVVGWWYYFPLAMLFKTRLLRSRASRSRHSRCADGRAGLFGSSRRGRSRVWVCRLPCTALVRSRRT